MGPINLEEDLKMLELYTADMIAGNLDLLADHYENIYKGKYIAYCIECIRKHLRKLSHYAAECIEGSCRPQTVWKKVAQWATEAEPYTDKLGKDDSKTLELSQEARLLRKEMEKIINERRKDIKEEELPHKGGVLYE